MPLSVVSANIVGEIRSLDLTQSGGGYVLSK